jgi:membrane protease YdiL (CAAX protease family)
MEPTAVPLKSLALAAVGVLCLEALARWAGALTAAPALALTAAARLLDLAWIGWVVHRYGPGARGLAVDASRWLPGLRRGCLWSLGFGAAALGGYAVLRLAGLDPAGLLFGGRPLRPSQPVLLFAVGGVLAPIVEEVFFRGLVFGWLRRWGFWPALFLSAAAFASLHPAAVPWTQLVGGLVFAAAYEIERNLWVPIVIHVLGNLALFSLPFVLG